MSWTRTFTRPERHEIANLARQRLENHTETWSVDDNRLENEALGIAAELAVCGWLGLPEDPVFEDYGAGGDGDRHDLTLPDGRVVEVKATSYPNGRLILPNYQTVADATILCVQSGPGSLRCAGWASRARIEARGYTHDFDRGHGPQRVVDQEDLASLGQLGTDLIALGETGLAALAAPEPTNRSRFLAPDLRDKS